MKQMDYCPCRGCSEFFSGALPGLLLRLWLGNVIPKDQASLATSVSMLVPSVYPAGSQKIWL